KDLILAEVSRARVDAVIAGLAEAAPAGEIRVAEELSVRVLPEPDAADASDGEAAVWAEVVHELRTAGRFTWSNLLLITAAAAIAAVGVIQGQLLLIVGAMALSPDYLLIANAALALSRRAVAAFGRAAIAIAVSFAVAVVGAWLLAEVLTATGVVTRAEHGSPAILFISRPSVLSAVVALIAGVAGAISLTLPGTRGLVGVLVSVTTIPAAATIGVAAARRDPAELAGASLQLLVNVASLLVRHHPGAGVAVRRLRRMAAGPGVSGGGPGEWRGDPPPRPAARGQVPAWRGGAGGSPAVAVRAAAKSMSWLNRNRNTSRPA